VKRADNKSDTIVVKKEGQGGDETSVTIKDRIDKRVTKYANDEPTAIADNCDMNASLFAGINNNICNKSCGVEATQDLRRHYEVDAVRTSNIINLSIYRL